MIKYFFENKYICKILISSIGVTYIRYEDFINEKKSSAKIVIDDLKIKIISSIISSKF